jgi:diguanylate cyclase (GGDEF)-like protein/PAS domain S-box-containing protein
MAGQSMQRNSRSSETNLRIWTRALDLCPNAIFITRHCAAGDFIEYANRAFERTTGYRPEDYAGRDCSLLQRSDGVQTSFLKLREAMATHREVETVVHNYTADGQIFITHLFISPIKDDEGKVTHHVVAINDVTEATEAQRRLEYQANFDALTALPNRSYFFSSLRRALFDNANAGCPVAVGFLDLDDFKVTNDSLGHIVGDLLLREVAQRLTSAIPSGGMVARYGGDEFALFVPGVGSTAKLLELARSISDRVSGVVTIDEHQIEVVLSLGFSASPQHGCHADTLIKHADFAMYQAKSSARGGVCIYDESIGKCVERRQRLLTSLRRAVRNDEFTLVFQPQIDTRKREIVAVEALLRWSDSETGQTVSPAEFIPLAEESSLIVAIGNWVLGEACRHAKILVDAGYNLRVAVNVSPKQFSDGAITSRVAETIGTYGLTPSSLELEITEGTLIKPGFVPLIKELALWGAGIAVDDFGTGYSNLSVLQTVRPNRIKLDMSLVRGIGNSSEGDALVRAALELGKIFGATVLAEGVETVEQKTFLESNGCSEMQGYLFARPMEFHGLLALLEAASEASGVLSA